jgi:hypothetical protein
MVETGMPRIERVTIRPDVAPEPMPLLVSLPAVVAIQT